MANICFVSLKIECRSKRAALKVNAVLMQLKEAADQQRKGFYAGSDRYIFDAAFYVYEKEVSMAYKDSPETFRCHAQKIIFPPAPESLYSYFVSTKNILQKRNFI